MKTKIINMKRNYNYIKIDEILEKDFYNFHDSFKFGINSEHEKVIEELQNDFGLHETNTIMKINDWDMNEDSEIEKFYRIFKYENEFLLYEVNFEYEKGFTTVSVIPLKSFEEIILFYEYAFKQGMVFHKNQVEKLFGNENNPLTLIKMAFQNLDYKYIEASSYDDFGIMTLHFKHNDSKFHLIGPLIEVDGTIDSYFDLELHSRLIDDYPLKMDDTFITGYLSFSSLFANLNKPKELKLFLYTDNEYFDLIEKLKP